MRSKAPLALMEQMIMVLVFALAAALCLRAFAFSDRLSRQNEARDSAVILAQNTAEMLKACGGVEEAAKAVGGELQQGLWSTRYHEDLSPAPDGEEVCYQVDVLPESSAVDGLGRATVAVFLRDGSEALFTLPVAWQEVTGHG